MHPNPTDSCSLYLELATVGALPLHSSRHNTNSRSHAITRLVKSKTIGVDEFVVIVCEREDVYASGAAVARAFSLYSRKTNKDKKLRLVTVEFIIVDGEKSLSQEDIEVLENSSKGIQLAAKIVDMPCNEMNVSAFLAEVDIIGKELGIVPQVEFNNTYWNKEFK